MSDRQDLVDELIADEGLYLKPYRCPAGFLTIGVGRNLETVGLRPREVMELLEHDVDEAVADLAGSFPWFVTLDGVRQRAVVNLRFNLGPKRFRTFQKFLAAMARKDYPAAAAELVASKWYAQIQTSRRERICGQIRSGE
jgi:lysozyme